MLLYYKIEIERLIDDMEATMESENDLREQNRKKAIQVIEQALETLEFDFQTFQSIVGDSITIGQTPEGHLTINYALGIELVNILRLLHLNSSHLSEGYDREKHLAVISHAIERKEFHYKRGKLVRAAWKNFKRERWKSEAKLMGFRLRWRIRIRRWFSETLGW